MVEQAKQASERIAEAERVKISATQEAAYYRAKLAALENNNESDVSRLDRERANDLERHISALMGERWAQDRRLNELNDSLALQTTLYEQAEARAIDATKRAEQMEENIQRQTDLQAKVDELGSQLRDHKERLISQTSLLEQREAEEITLRSQLEDLVMLKDRHVRALEQTQTALQAASNRAEEVDNKYQRARERIGDLENDIVDLRSDIEARTAEIEYTRNQLNDVENAWAKSREEADAFRSLTTRSLGELLDSHRDLKADEDRLTRGHQEKVQALESEIESLKLLLRDSSQSLEDTLTKLNEERRRTHDHEGEQSSLRSQILGLRAQLSNAITNAGQLRKDMGERDNRLVETTKAYSDGNIKLNMLRNYLAENGVKLNEDDLLASFGGSTEELEKKLAEQTWLHENAERELTQTIRRKKEADAQINQLQAQLDQLRVGGSANDSSSATEFERKLEETERGYKARMQQMEEDYQLAVHYVK